MMRGDEAIALSANGCLARRYGRLPFRFPVNDTLTDLLSHIFSEDEAHLASVFPASPTTIESLTRRARMPRAEVESHLSAMDLRGVIASFHHPKGRKYYLLPLIPGIFELVMWSGAEDEGTLRFAELVEEYYTRDYYAFPAKGVVKVVPMQRHIDSQPGVLSTDRVFELIDSHTSFSLAQCCCRRSAEMRGESCGKPLDVCMAFGQLADYVVERGLARRVDGSEIRDAATLAEEEGLIHLTDNVAQANFLCSCCSCCCTALKVITEFDYPWVVAKSHFMAQVDADQCQSCGACVERCPADALEPGPTHMKVDDQRCIGCGVCVSACPQNSALSLVPRSSYTLPHESMPELAADLGLQAIGVGPRIDSRFPGAVSWLRQKVARHIRRSFTSPPT